MTKISKLIAELSDECRKKGLDYYIITEDKNGNVNSVYGCRPGSTVDKFVELDHEARTN